MPLSYYRSAVNQKKASPNFAQNQRMNRLKRISLCIISLFSTFVQAQDSTVLLENIVVTASQAAQQQKESGRNIISVSGAAFSSLPIHSLDELLRYLPGIEIQQRGPQGAQADITIRGGTFQQVLVIIDGVKLNDPLTGHFSMYIPVHPGDIERVEILKGAASAIWGAEAVGGVVNIITKTFAGKPVKKEYKARIQAGEYGLFNADGFIRWTKGKSNISGGLLTNNADGQKLRGTSSFFHLHTANLSFSRQMQGNWRLSIRTAADWRKFNAQNYYTSFASDTANEKVNSGWIQAGLQKKYATGQLQVDAAYKKLRDQYWFRPSSLPNDNHSSYYTIQAYYTGEINKQNGYTIGAQTIRKSIRSNDRGNHSLWHGAVYSIFRHKPGHQFYINESLRLDWDESYGWVLVPQVNLAWSPSRITLRAAAGKSFRDADFTERYNNYNKALVTSGRIGNPSLEAERSWNAEIGADYHFTSRFRISSSLFYRDYSNLIDWANTPYADMPRKTNLVPTGNYSLALNVENVRTRGVELDLLYNEKTGPSSQLLLMGGVTWLQSENEDSVPSLYISSHAKWLVNLTASWMVKRFNFSVTGMYKERAVQKSTALNTALTPSYFVINAKAGWQFTRQRGRIFIQADNLLDKTYSDLLGALMPGRWLSAGIEIAL